MPKMRLVTEAYKEIKEADPNTALTLCALRRLINSGVIPVCTFGRKKLINMDVLLDYLGREGPTEPVTSPMGSIRQVAV